MGFSTSTVHTNLWRSWLPKLPFRAAAELPLWWAAVGTALGNMVGSLTVGKKKYADVEGGDVGAEGKMRSSCRQSFLRLIERDAEVFEPLSRGVRTAERD